MPPRKRKPQQRRPDGKVTNKKGKEIPENRLRNIAADYGWAYSVLEDNPQIFNVFEQAIENSWSPQRFIAEIQDTNWFKNHSDTWRQAMYLEQTDPQTAKQRKSEIGRTLQDQAGALGIEVTGKQLQEWSEQAFRFGWDQTKINNVLANQVRIMGKHSVGGSLAETQDRLESFAYANGVNVSKPTMQRWLQAIVRGNSTTQEYEQYITKMAVAKFPNWHKELNAGMTVQEIAEPYRQTMAELLEVNPADVTVNDKTIMRALSRKNDKGEYRELTLTDFEDEVRKDPRWQYTENARQQVSGIAASLLQTFGELA